MQHQSINVENNCLVGFSALMVFNLCTMWIMAFGSFHYYSTNFFENFFLYVWSLFIFWCIFSMNVVLALFAFLIRTHCCVDFYQNFKFTFHIENLNLSTENFTNYIILSIKLYYAVKSFVNIFLSHRYSLFFEFEFIDSLFKTTSIWYSCCINFGFGNMKFGR